MAAWEPKTVKVVHVHHFMHTHTHTHRQDVPTPQFRRYQRAVQRVERKAAQRQAALGAPAVRGRQVACLSAAAPAPAPSPPPPATTSPRRLFTPFAMPCAAPYVRYHDRPRPQTTAGLTLWRIMCCLESIWEALRPYVVPCANLALQVLDFVLSRTSIGFLLRPDWRTGVIATN